MTKNHLPKAFLVLLLLCSTVFAGPPKDGTIITWSKDKGFLAKGIKKHTGSNMVHAAIVLYDGENIPWVYEAAVQGVVATEFSEYEVHLDKLQKKWSDVKFYLIEPRNPYTPHELYRMKVYANSQLGRKYQLKGWWKKREVKGIHCSQLIGNILERSGRVSSKNFKEAPIDIYKKAIEMGIKR